MRDTRTRYGIPALLALLMLTSAAEILHAQAEHVPATHPVYLFLNRQHVLGNVRGYSRAYLPMELKRVRDFLRQLRHRIDELSHTERDLLSRFEDEFFAGAADAPPPRSIAQASIPGMMSSVFSDSTTHFFAWRSASGESTMFMEVLASLEYRTLLSDQGNSNVTLGQIGGRFRGTLGGLLGYSLTATNGMASGNRSLALSDPQLRRNFNFAALDKEYFDLTEAVLSMSWDWGSASVGKETRFSGTGRSNQVLLSANAAPIDAVQLDARFGAVRFSFLHGALLSEFTRLPDGKPYYDAKYVSMHRVEADLFELLRLGVFEAVVYSGREMDLAYLNPINFYKSAEHAGGDRDNPMLGLELSTLGIGGLELYGSWLIDDVDFSLLGKSWWGNKFILQAGATASSLLPDCDITVEYSRIDPYVYTHRFMGNQYAHDRAALGFELPPNSDEVYVGVDYWAGAALRLGAALQLRRHGANETDAEGNIVVNHGGDIYESMIDGRDSDIAPFLAGMRDNSTLLTLMVVWEPWRDMFLKGTYRFRDRDSQVMGRRSDQYLSLLLDVRL
jgi:hypothetical protein